MRDFHHGLLGTFGLGGSVSPVVRRTLLELSEVRNALVHRYGTADRRLVERCPWLGLKAGEPVVVSHGQLWRYHAATVTYSSELLQRLCTAFELGRDPGLDKQIAEADAQIERGAA